MFVAQIINHGIDQALMDKALGAADDFFHLPTNEKMKFMSSDVHKPVRYGTSIKDGVDKIQYWRVFLKHYANPLNDWILSWPENPPNYRYIYISSKISKDHVLFPPHKHFLVT